MREDDSKDEYDVRKQEEVLAETVAMIPDTRGRLERGHEDLEELLGEPLRPGMSLRRVSSFRSLGVRWAAGLSHRPSLLAGRPASAVLDNLMERAAAKEKPKARRRVIHRAGGDGRPSKARATAA